MDGLIGVIMGRDCVSRKEAEALVMECRNEIECGNFNAMAEVLGLEDDYFDYLF